MNKAIKEPGTQIKSINATTVSPTFVMNFELVKAKFDLNNSPRRPVRCKPAETEVAEDMQMWELASDEAGEMFDAEIEALED